MKDDNYGSNDLDDEIIKEGRGWLPQWWMLILYGGIIFSIFFTIYYHVILGWTSKGQYQDEIKAYAAQNVQMVVTLNEDGSNPLRGDATAIANGKKNFTSICAACHKLDATGIIGPDLTDNVFLHGNTDADMFEVIMEGINAEQIKQNPPKGIMTPHKNSLGAKKVLETMAWLASKNPNIVAGGK